MNNQLKDFIKKNETLIYEYINKEVLQDIAVMNYNYFLKVVQDIQIDENYDSNLFPYLLFTQVGNKGKIDYTSLRAESIDFKQINKESLTYYNYARFSVNDKYLVLELMQSKFGGMPVDNDIAKFTKKIEIKNSGLKEFILQHKDS